MVRTCKKCGYVTQETQTNRCVLCKTPFSTTSDDLPATTSKIISASKEPKNPVSTDRDDRSWLVKSIHSRSIGGMILAFLMIVGGLLGSGMSRANMTITGIPLVMIGIVVFIFSTALFFATKRR